MDSPLAHSDVILSKEKFARYALHQSLFVSTIKNF